MALFNPVLVAIVCTGVSIGASYYVGVSTGVKQEAARYAVLADASAEAARLESELEAEARKTRSIKVAAAESASSAARLQGQLNAIQDAPRVDCDLNPVGMRDINTAVDAANGLDAGSERVSYGMSRDSKSVGLR